MQTFTDTIRYRFVLENLVSKNLKVMYRNQALGFVWAVVQPLVMMLVLTFVMVYVFQGGDHPAARAIVGIVPFNFISYCLSGCAMSVVGAAGLVKKVAFPRQLLPFSVIVTNLVHLAIQAPLVLVVLLIDTPPNAHLGLHLLWLPAIFVVHLGLALGAGLLVAAVNVSYRDVQYMIDSLMTVLFWLSPVMYDSQLMAVNAPQWVQTLYFCNPLAGIIDAYRAVLFHGTAPDPRTLSLAFLITLVIGAFGVRRFWVHERDFADLV
jgi:ABC-type polysaccharide/polyol phosphate export permease